MNSKSICVLRQLRSTTKKLGLYISKWIGLFYLTEFVTRRGLRILCYHGFSVKDESEFSPEAFMKPETFVAHINLLIRRRYRIISLNDAIKGLNGKSLPPCPVVITFDDGFQPIMDLGIPILSRYHLPATIYVTTYYSIKPNPVFRLVVQYMFWKTSRKEVDLTGMGLPFFRPVSLRPMAFRDETAWKIIDYAERELREDDRKRIAEELGTRLAVPYGDIVERKALSIMDSSDLKELIQADGIDIQLHTHRHTFPEGRNAAIREIEDNRSILEPIAGKSLNHFCYPSGIWSKNHFQILKESNIESAVTCDVGFNYDDTPRYALKRFLDGQHISNIEFEAELSGLLEIMRKLRDKKRTLFHQSNRC